MYARLRRVTSIIFGVAIVVASLMLYGCGGGSSGSGSASGYKSGNTKRSELRFRAVLGSSAREVSVELR